MIKQINYSNGREILIDIDKIQAIRKQERYAGGLYDYKIILDGVVLNVTLDIYNEIKKLFLSRNI